MFRDCMFMLIGAGLVQIPIALVSGNYTMLSLAVFGIFVAVLGILVD